MNDNKKFEFFDTSRANTKKYYNNTTKFKTNEIIDIKTYKNIKINNKIFFFYILLFFIYISLSQAKKSLRKINANQIIVLNAHLPGNDDKYRLLGYDFISEPKEVYVNDLQYEFSEGDDKKLINLSSGDYVIRIILEETPENLENMFQGIYGVTKIDLSNFDTSNVKNMQKMFQYCHDLEEIDFTGIDTSKVTNMEGMFQSCKKLTSLDLSGFDTSSVTTMRNMFTTCEGLTYLDVSNFDTSEVKDMVEMFCDCLNLETIDVSSFSTNGGANLGGMFKYCLKLKSIKFSDSNKLICSNIGSMFQTCPELTSLDLSNFVTSSVTDISYIFEGCQSLVSIDLSSFDTSSVSKFENAFTDCYSLLTLDLSNFQTNSADNFKNMFLNCKSLEYLDLSTFTTTSITVFESMFSGCSSLIYLNLKNFVRYGEAYNRNMFEGVSNSTIFCYPSDSNLIGEENAGLVSDCDNKCFKNSRKLIIDLKSCEESCNIGDYKYEYQNNCYTRCPDGTVSSTTNQFICVKIKVCQNYYNFEKTECFDEVPEGYYVYNIENKILDKCHQDCKTCNQKEDEETSNCLTCSNENYYLYYGKCLENCRDGIPYENSNGRKACTCIENRKCRVCPLINNGQNLCLYCNEGYYPKCSQEGEYKDCFDSLEGYYLNTEDKCFSKIIDTDNPTQDNNKNTEKNEEIRTNIPSTITINEDNWSAENFFLGLYIADEDNKINKDEIIGKIREEIINHNLDTIIKNVIEEKEDKFIQEDNALYQITTSENQNENSYTNVSTIKLGDCEDTLKGAYDIWDNETLIILKIDYNITGLLIPIIGYEVYHPRYKSKLNLSLCEKSTINYNIPVTIDESNLDKYDPKSEYYTDECSTFTTKDGTDILLNDRKEEFSEKNLSLCENMCEYVEYNSTSKKAICECGIRYQEFVLSDIDSQTNLLSNNLVTDNTTSNIGTLKCYDTLFTKKGLLSNSGSYIVLITLIFHLISIIIFYKCGYHILETTIQDIIDEKKMQLKSLKKKESRDKKKKTGKKEKKEKFRIKEKYSKSPKRKSIIESSNKREYQSNSNLYMIKQKVEKTKKTSIFFLSPKKLKKRKSVANPIKKQKSKKHNTTIENTNIGNNSKSSTKIRLRNSTFKLKYDKSLRNSAKIFSKKKIDNLLKNSISNILNVNINIKSLNEFEINSMDYMTALILDKRSMFECYMSLLKIKHPLIFTFCLMNDFNIFIIKMCLLLFSFVIYFAFNTIFFDLSIIHKIYKDGGKYNLTYLFPLIFYSFIISYHINIIIKYVTLSERNILEVKKENIIKKANNKVAGVERCLIIKYICYFIISILILVLFWYYLSSFCAVYKNSQIPLIKNTFFSFTLALIYPFFINIIPAVLRKFSLSNKNRICLYNFNKIIQFFI